MPNEPTVSARRSRMTNSLWMAVCALGLLLLRMLPQGRKLALEYSRELDAATRGDARSQYNMGIRALSVSHATQAVDWFTKAAHQGLAEAQYNLALAYQDGLVIKDAAAAVEWYTRAAEQGFSKAEYNLGFMYMTGLDVPQDKVKAIEWFTKAVGHGDVKAACHLGVLLLGKSRDMEAYKWNCIAKNVSILGTQANKVASANMGLLEVQMSSGQIKQAKQEATAWLQQFGHAA